MLKSLAIWFLIWYNKKKGVGMDTSLKIKEIKKHGEFVLQNQKTKQECRLILQFYGIQSPQVGDVLLLNERLLNPKDEWFSQPYAFEALEDSDDGLKEIDLAGLITKDKKYLLKRVYG